MQVFRPVALNSASETEVHTFMRSYVCPRTSRGRGVRACFACLHTHKTPSNTSFFCCDL